MSPSRGVAGKAKQGSMERSIAAPSTEDVIEYLAAFYQGLDVKELPIDLAFTAWDDRDQCSKRVQATPVHRSQHGR